MAALTAVWRYRLLFEAGIVMPVCDSHSFCGEGREVAVVISIPAAERAEGWLLVIFIPAGGWADGFLQIGRAHV